MTWRPAHRFSNASTACHFIAVTLLTAVGLFGHPCAEAESTSPGPVPAPLPSMVSPEAAWSGSYLLSYTFANEYELFWRHVEKEKQQPIDSDEAIALWKRAEFATAAMDARSQTFQDLSSLKKHLEDHFVALSAKDPSLKDVRKSLIAAASLQTGKTAPDATLVKQGYVELSGSFRQDAERERLSQLVPFYFADAPTCPISAEDVKQFASHQKQLLTQNGSINGGQLLVPIKDWSLKKVRCLVFALMATPPEAKMHEGTDPLPLMLTLQQTSSPLARDASYKATLAIRLLQTRQFAETLRSLFDLVELQSAYRLPYELVQKIFSMEQKGDGQVALKGI